MANKIFIGNLNQQMDTCNTIYGKYFCYQLRISTFERKKPLLLNLYLQVYCKEGRTCQAPNVIC